MILVWALAANRSRAKIYSVQVPGFEMRLAHDFDFPRGRLQNRELDADRPGRTWSPFGANRSSLAKINIHKNP